MNFCVAILILKMEEKKQHFWHIMLYCFKKGKNTIEMQKKICVMYKDWTCQTWFVKFHAWAFSLDGALQWDRPVEIYNVKLKN